MRKPGAILGSAIFFVAVPSLMAGVVPWLITGWAFQPPFLGSVATRGVGAVLILAGLRGLLDSFRRFAMEGLGTPAPIAPTEKLVITGLYRYVRNPMYVAVLAIILGQWLLFADWRLLIYGAAFWLITHIFVVAYEEPTLRESFGAAYDAYRQGVPRWLPRFNAWREGGYSGG